MKRAIVIFVIAYAVVCAWVSFIQRGLLYFPTHKNEPTTLETWMAGAELIGYKREVRGAKGAWLLLHGNGGQASTREFVLRKFDPRDSVYLLEYPGFGARGGSPSEETINAAARDALGILRVEKRYQKVGVVGESLGSGPASFLGSLETAPDKIVLLVPYDEIVAVAGERYWWLPVRLLMRDQWNNSKALANYRGTLEVFAAENDEVIPLKHALRLHSKLPQSRLTVFKAGHNDWPDQAEVRIRFDEEGGGAETEK